VRILFFYRLFQLVSFPFILLFFAIRLLTKPAYWPHFGERLGFLPRRFTRTAPGAIWLHAVSVGEISTAVPLLEKLRQDDPRVPIYVSTTTLAGRQAAEQKLNGFSEAVFFCPLDYASFVRRILRKIRPSLVIILETEIWPNLYAQTKASGARLAIVNGRISDRTWPQYRRTRWLFAPLMNLPDAVFAQTATDRDRFLLLGVPPSRLHLEGNIKYDATGVVKPSDLPTFGAEKVWIAASTVAPNESRHYKHAVDEDDIVLATFARLKEKFPRLLLILAPRQPSRFDTVAQKLSDSRLPYLRRTDLRANRNIRLALPGVLLLDTIGELGAAFALADAVFVGGSIAPRGGHNILEPAAFAKPIVTGTHMENFQAIARDFADAGALLRVRDGQELSDVVEKLLHDTQWASTLGQRGKNVLEQQRGAAQRIATKLWPLFWSACATPMRGFWTILISEPLSWLWVLGSRLKQKEGKVVQGHLPVPVISVGGITVGGAGKTPFVNYLTRGLHQRGVSAGILTRGYRKRTPAKSVIVPAGTDVSPALTGDEAQIFLRSGLCPVGIGANRLKTGWLVLQNYPVDAMVLDDGFQHAALCRDVDVVMIDGLNPFGGGSTLPVGRLREPLDNLKRAHAFVVSRADNDLRFEFLKRELKKWNADAPAFRVRTGPKCWRVCTRREILKELPVKKVGAFCGLGNPQGFWNTLAGLGLEVAFRWEFPDHHPYKPVELHRLSSQARRLGAEMLVTTEKDRINFPVNFVASAAPLDIAWLEIESVLDEEDEFFNWLAARLPSPPIPASSQ
jgi:tetraacyldisaccharide 4'-kinase